MCTLTRFPSSHARLIQPWHQPQASGNHVELPTVRVWHIPPLSSNFTVMREIKHMLQAWCESLSSHCLTHERRHPDMLVCRGGILYRRFLTRIVCKAIAVCWCTATGAQQGEATQCRR